MSTRTFNEIQADVNHAISINDADLLMSFAEELDAIATPQAMALANRSRGWAHFCRGEYPAAMRHFHRALDLYEKLGNRWGVATVNDNIGTMHISTGDYPEALSHYHRALALHEELCSRSGMANATGNIGIVHWITGDYPEALSHYHRALAIHEELGERSGVARVTGNIGNVHKDTGDYPAALSHFHRALALHEELGDRSGVASVTGNIGSVHWITGDYPEALSHYHRALALHEELSVRIEVAIVTGNIGLVHADTGDYPAALSNYHRALAVCEELGIRYGVAIVTSNIIDAYLAMGSDAEAQSHLATMDGLHIDDPGRRIQREHHRATLLERSGDIDAAAVTLQHALSEALEHGLRSLAADVHKALRDLALKQNNLAGYVEHNNEFTRITEEINGKDTATKLAMQAKQREIDAREKEHQKHMAVLHSTLPKHIADRVARGETVNDSFDNAAVLFLDVVGFTTNSSELDAGIVVALLQEIFTRFDAICAERNVMKIKTIGDSYMAVAFDEEQISGCEQRAADAAHAMISSNFTWPSGESVQFRIGLHSGPVVAGVLGTERMQYDVWGDTVNVASRMESTSEPGRIHVSEAFANAISDENNSPFPIPYSLRERGTLEVKGKGMMKTFWLE